MSERTPSEFARETLKLLASRKLQPTPDNFAALYREVSGDAFALPFPDEPLRQIAKALPAQNPGQQKQRALFELAVGKRDWGAVQTALVGFAGFGVPVASKSTPISPPLPPKMAFESTPTPSLAVPMTPEFLQQIARLIDNTLPALGLEDDARFAEQAKSLLARLRSPNPDMVGVKLALADFSHRVSFVAEEQTELKAALLELMQLILRNVGQITVQDQWLQGQIEALSVAAQPPLSLRRLDDMKTLLKDVIFKQKQAIEAEQLAQEQLRKLLGTFMERLGALAQSSSGFHDNLVQYSQQIESAQSLGDIAPVLESAMSATQLMAQDSMGVQHELDHLRQQADSAQQQIQHLHQELDRITMQARHDPLTGVLNRRGLDEAMEREFTRARQLGQPLCLALLDIDNFRQIAQSHGPAASDAALVHLAAVAREYLRPQDSMARYGGEAFVVLLPDTGLDQAIQAVTHLQRELSKRIFLEQAEKLLITFSAGVAQSSAAEVGADTLKRADQAMFLAKRSGKNRVLAG